VSRTTSRERTKGKFAISFFRVRRSTMTTTRFTAAALVCMIGLLPVEPTLGQDDGFQERDFSAYPADVAAYLKRVYAQDRRPLAYRDDYPGGFKQWQQDARAALRDKLGLERIAASVGDHPAVVELGKPEEFDGYTRQPGTIETEPDVRIPFWLLKPEGEGPWPLGVFPHGHDRRGHDTTAGVFADEAHRKKSLAEDRDVAVQAVRRGFVAVAPAVRGLAVDGVPDLHARHGNRPCRSQLMHCLAAGRTAIGERVWDMQRILDWALGLPEVSGDEVLMMGNSGGGMVTVFAAACDERITIAVPSCSFAPTAATSGYLFHCDCNMVPGLLDIGGLPGVAGLIAPRWLLAVNGRRDRLFSQAEIERGAARVARIYEAAGSAERFEHRWGEAGHRFYGDLMWPFVDAALGGGAGVEK
jgi:dienelactone hydrolase